MADLELADRDGDPAVAAARKLCAQDLLCALATAEWYGHLCAYRTGKRLRDASDDERERSRVAMAREHAKGVFWLDGVEVYVDERPDMGAPPKHAKEG